MNLFHTNSPAVRRALHLSLAVFIWTAVLPPASRAQVYKGVELVKASLVADTAAIVPGKPFTIGLRLKMAPHWHTYWQYAGDAGLPTKIEWQLPEGFKAGPIQWPVPEKIVSGGDIVNYGYSDEVLLMTEITAPSELPNQGLKIKAKVDWLVCESLCVPGSADLAVEILPAKLTTAAAPVSPDAAALFAKYRALLPQEESVLPARVRAEPPKDKNLSFVVENWKSLPANVDFFPIPAGSTEVQPPTVQIDQKKASVLVQIPVSTDLKEAKVSGLLVADQDGRRVGWKIDPWTAAPSSASSAPIAAPSGNNGPKGAAASVPTPGLLHFLLLGLLGGLILNVMPCVLPVISLKIFSFIQQANEEPARVLRLGLAYVSGIFTWFIGFAVLVIILKSAGRQVGYAMNFQNLYFMVGLSAVVFVFSLSLLGVFEVIVPGVDAAGAVAAREGYAGAFFQGVLATVLASACTAPFFGPALGFAFSQPAAVVLVMFTSIALGMALPFLLLAARPDWLRYLPKPGAWMERVKQITGFLMLATVLWLLSIVGALRGVDAVIWTGGLLLALGAACWVHGTFNTFSASPGVRSLAWVTIAILAIGGGWFCIGQVVQAHRPVAAESGENFTAKIQRIESLAKEVWTAAESGGDSAEKNQRIQTLAKAVQAAAESGEDFTSRLDAALKENRPVFVDFTAEWCVNCKVNERSVLATAPIQQALKERNAIFLKADWTDGAPDITKLLRQFGRAGVPLYVVYPAGKPADAIVLPELLTQQMVLDALAEADKKSSSGRQVAAAGQR